MRIVPYWYPLSARNPYPVPQRENDDNFRGKRFIDKQRRRLLPTEVAFTEEPWNRISRRHTLSSMRHEVCYRDPNAPSDSLDLVLKAFYDHDLQFLKDKNEVVLQSETLGAPHGRILKNRIYHIPLMPPALGHPLRVANWPRRDHPSSKKADYVCHHSCQTEYGYHERRPMYNSDSLLYHVENPSPAEASSPY